MDKKDLAVVLCAALLTAMQHSGVQAAPKQSNIQLGSYGPKNVAQKYATFHGLRYKRSKKVNSRGIGHPRVAHWNTNKIKHNFRGAGNRWNDGRVPDPFNPGYRIRIEELSPRHIGVGAGGSFSPIGGN